MKSIILFGLINNHHSLYKHLLLLLDKHFKRITFITSENIALQIVEINKIQNLKIRYSSMRIDIIIKKNLDIINAHDVLIMDEYYGLYSRIKFFKCKCKKKVLIIHNSNKWLQSTLNYNPKHLYDQLFKRRFLNQFDAILTMGPNIKNYYLALNRSKPVFFFPFDQPFSMNNLAIEKLTPTKNNIDIVIPGMITNKRRNYTDLLNILRNYFRNNKNSIIRIKLLGKLQNSEEQHIINHAREINNLYGEKIFWWNSYIPNNSFEKEIRNSDFILSNIHTYNNFDSGIEIYGITKESGISFTIYKNAKIAIVPKSQNILLGFENQLINFNDYKELYEIFTDIEKKQIDTNSLRNNALKNKINFNKLVESENKIFLNFLLKE